MGQTQAPTQRAEVYPLGVTVCAPRGPKPEHLYPKHTRIGKVKIFADLCQQTCSRFLWSPPRVPIKTGLTGMLLDEEPAEESTFTGSDPPTQTDLTKFKSLYVCKKIHFRFCVLLCGCYTEYRQLNWPATIV
jgi:hypothetical protein